MNPISKTQLPFFTLACVENRESMAKSPQEEHPQKAFGWAARDPSGILSPFHFSRRHFLFLFFCVIFFANCNLFLCLIRKYYGISKVITQFFFRFPCMSIFFLFIFSVYFSIDFLLHQRLYNRNLVS